MIKETEQQALYATVMDDLVGMVKSRAISLAAQLQLAELVKDGPKSLTELAQATGTQQVALYRLSYALTNCGYFEEFESGNFFEALPPGADPCLLKQIIHNWEDAECIRILTNCRKAMNTGGRVLVIDEIIALGNQVPYQNIRGQ